MGCSKADKAGLEENIQPLNTTLTNSPPTLSVISINTADSGVSVGGFL